MGVVQVQETGGPTSSLRPSTTSLRLSLRKRCDKSRWSLQNGIGVLLRRSQSFVSTQLERSQRPIKDRGDRRARRFEKLIPLDVARISENAGALGGSDRTFPFVFLGRPFSACSRMDITSSQDSIVPFIASATEYMYLIRKGSSYASVLSRLLCPRESRRWELVSRIMRIAAQRGRGNSAVAWVLLYSVEL